MFLLIVPPLTLSAFVLFFPPPPLSSGVDGPLNISIETISDSLKKRHERFETGRVEFEQDTTYPKGTLHLDQFSGAGAKNKGPFPLETTTKHTKVSVTFSRDFVRYSKDGPNWVPEVQDFLPMNYTSVNNGEESITYFSKAFGEYPLAFISKPEKGNPDAAAVLDIAPLLRQFRPLHSSMGRLFPSAFAIRVQGAKIGQHNCVVVDQVAPGGKETFWLDRDRNFIILKSQRDFGGGGFEQLDISYSNDKRYGWVPSSWRGVWMYSFDRGKSMRVKESFVARVTRYDFNFPFRVKDFELPLSPGTRVKDGRTSESYIVREGNGKRLITDQELIRKASYRELLNSESGQAGLARSNRRWLLPLIISLQALLVTLGVWWYIKKRQRKKRAA